MHLVIVAGGLGSRLAPLTNHIPKFLVNIGKETGFVEQVNFWKGHDLTSITVIVHGAYAALVDAYYRLYFKDDQRLVRGGAPTSFHVRTVNVANGSAAAIMTTCQHLEGQPVLFSWCDVLPARPLDTTKLGHDRPVVFTNYDHPNRYGLAQVGPRAGQCAPVLRPDGRGGVFGLYYLPVYTARPYADGQDFVEVIAQYSPDGYVTELEVPRIVDFGDKPKLERTRASADAARAFNVVQVHGDLVLKAAVNPQGESLIEREIKWYDELIRVGSNVRRPQVWTSNQDASFVMSRVKGEPVWRVWPTLDDEARALVLSRLLEQLDDLHRHKRHVGSAVVQRDVKVEAHDKLVRRYLEIADVIKAFGPITVVNGMPLETRDPIDLIKRLYHEIALCYSSVEQHSLIHGDLQMSNSMIDPDTLEVTLIDPRGYFGQSDTYGLADYDLAKLRYSLSGYDLFNYSHEFHIDKPQFDHLCFRIPTPSVKGIGGVATRFGWAHELWTAVCWIGLAQYIKNDPVKAVAAHYHGLLMAERLLGSERTGAVVRD